jgi:hypothetical protein
MSAYISEHNDLCLHIMLRNYHDGSFLACGKHVCILHVCVYVIACMHTAEISQT